MLLADLGHIIDGPTDMYVDNKGVIAISQDYLANERTKHIERRHLEIREPVLNAVIRIQYIFTNRATRSRSSNSALRSVTSRALREQVKMLQPRAFSHDEKHWPVTATGG